MIYTCSLTYDHDAVLKGNKIILNKQELFEAVVKDDCREIYFKPEFVSKFFTKVGFQEFVKEATKINKLLRVINLDEFETEKQLLTSLDRIDTAEEYIEYILRNRKDSVSLLKYILQKAEGNVTEQFKNNNKINNMFLEISELKKKEQELIKQNRNIQSAFDITRNRLETLISRINNNYQKDLDISKFEGINIEYNNYSKILYIKEITRIHYVDTLIYYLLEVLKALYSKPARLVVIEAPYAGDKHYMYPNCKKYTELTYKEVYSDNIYMSGFHYNIMEDILYNPQRLEYLIVLDRSGTLNEYLTGNKVETIYTSSTLSDINKQVLNNKIISYSPETLHVNHIDEFDSLNPEVKLSRYSSMDITKELVNLLERDGTDDRSSK